MFTNTYVEARQAFRDAALQGGFELYAYILPNVTGAEGEALSIDLAVKGAGNQVVLTSGLHGLEGLAGSACQIDCMTSLNFEGVKAIFIHAQNPYGFSFQSRLNENRVDLNRNFLDFRPELNQAYDLVHARLWNYFGRLAGDIPTAEGLIGWVKDQEASLGLDLLETAMLGQHRHPDGLFFGGTETQWSIQILKEIQDEFLGGSQKSITVDVHTGLGPPGYGELLYAGQPDDHAYELARRWLGEVSCPAAGNSIASLTHGVAHHLFTAPTMGKECGWACLEYGTLPRAEVLASLCADVWLRNHDVSTEASSTVRQIARAGFFLDNPLWKASILTRAREVVEMAVHAVRDP